MTDATLSDACDRIFDILLGGDGEAYFQAERFLEHHRPDLYDRLGREPPPEPIQVMRVTDASGEVYWMPGHSRAEAFESFGNGCRVDFFHATGVPNADQ